MATATETRTSRNSGRWSVFDHTADLGLRVTGPTAEAALTAAGHGLSALLADRRRVRGKVRVNVTLVSADWPALLADWLGELLYYHDSQSLLFRRCGITGLKRTPQGLRLEGWADGEPYDPVRHELHREIKSVTWHQLQFGRRQRRWEGRIILDI